MKLVFAIVNSEDDHLVIKHLNKEKFSVTKMASTGGFLRVGNTTLLVGTSEEKVERVIEIIRDHSKRRKQFLVNTEQPYMASLAPSPFAQTNEIEVGGATIFVVDVEKFEKV
ncbi:MAG: hypothetical protein E7407_04150 [Ruminococcaceae bacterium]|nr:hypothetical protein [Oscillospiraceae bacterium]